MNIFNSIKDYYNSKGITDLFINKCIAEIIKANNLKQNQVCFSIKDFDFLTDINLQNIFIELNKLNVKYCIEDDKFIIRW